MLNFWGVPFSIEGLSLQSKGGERVPGINSKRVVVTCIISSAYLYIYISLTKKYPKDKKKRVKKHKK